jgi:hypothetical protein
MVSLDDADQEIDAAANKHCAMSWRFASNKIKEAKNDVQSD